MKLNAQNPKQSLNKAFLKQPVNRDEIESFKANLQTHFRIIGDDFQSKKSKKKTNNHSSHRLTGFSY